LRAVCARGHGLAALLAVAAALLVGCGSDAPPPPTATFAGLGALPGYPYRTIPTGLSADGRVVIGTSTGPAGQEQAFRWRADTGMVGLGFLPRGTRSRAAAVSADGDRVLVDGDAVDAEGPRGSVAARWQADGGWQRIAPLNDSTLCTAGGLSGDATIAAGSCLIAGGNAAFRATVGGATAGLPGLGAGSSSFSIVSAVSQDGSVVAGSSGRTVNQLSGILWRADGSRSVPYPPAALERSSVSGVSRDGAVAVGGIADGDAPYRAYRWTEPDGPVPLAASALDLVESNAAAVSGSGGTIVGTLRTAAGTSAMIWDASRGMRRLETMLADDHRTVIPGWSLSAATAISDDGRTIAGQGIGPAGVIEGWIVRLPPD